MTAVQDLNKEMNAFLRQEYLNKLERELSRPIAGSNIKSISVYVDAFRDMEQLMDITKMTVVLVTQAGKRIKIPAEVKGFPQPELIAKLELFT